MFGWAVIGCGAIANTVAHEILKTGRHRIVSVYSRTMDRCVKFANRYDATPCASLVEAVTMDGVDGVYLATPHSCHYDEIMECIRLGVPVLSEKAFTINSRETRAIIESDRHSFVGEGMWTRYNPITREIVDLISSGKLGDIVSIDASFCYPYALSSFGERVVKREYGGGALLDIGVYTISYAVMLLGEPKSITSKMKISDRYDVDIYDEIDLEYEGGARCHLRCGLDRLTTCSATITCTKGSVKIPLFYRPTRVYINASGRRRTLRCKAGYIHEFDTVAAEIREGRMESEYMPLRDSLVVMKIMDEIRSMHDYRYPADSGTYNMQ